MCGIAGQVNRDRAKPVSRESLEVMREAIRHRGPDSGGLRLDGSLGLAVRRLAVIDLVTGDQPISNEDGTVWIVFNGELYNYLELREDLEGKGHRFRSRTDTETIVHLYEERGLACVEALNGMFAFALWDGPRRRLLLARDRLGEKPLYYAEHDGAFLFGSEIKCLLSHPGFPRRVHLPAIHHYLGLQCVPDPLTAFEGVRKLPPAHRLVWQDGDVRVERYWDLRYEPKLAGSHEELAEELVGRLGQAVRRRLVSEVPLGVHLSGGIDSSVVTALAAQASDRPLKTFSIGFEEERFSELPYARAVAERYGTDHHDFVVRYGDVPDLVRVLGRHFDEPFADPSAIPVYLLSGWTRRHVTVALNGDGGDELFAGYTRYGLDGYADLYRRLPSFLGRRVAPALLAKVAQPVDRPGDRNWVAGLKRLTQAADITPKANLLRWGSFFSESMKRRLWRPEATAELRRDSPDTEDWLASIFDAAPALSALDRTLYVDTRVYLASDLLVKADRMTMAHALEGRSPFLDHELQAWVARLPERHKRRGRVRKSLLRRAAASLLPPAVAKRGKQGFGIPLGAWLRGPLRQWMQDRLLAPSARTVAYFETRVVSALVEEHLRGRENHGNRLWALLMFEGWLEEYL